jgi:chromosome segregation ATPase
VDKKANDTFAFDLENRLDDFFSDALPLQDETPADEPPPPKTDLPLKELKSTILAIDWEITDDVLETFIDQLDGLLEQFEDDKVIHTLLRLLKSLGKYVRKHKSNAHPDTIKRIMAVYSALEESVANDGMSRSEKEKRLLEEVRQFQRLKALIVASKTPYVASGSQKPERSEDMPGIDAVIKAIDELKSMMAKELGAIREELGQLHNS